MIREGWNLIAGKRTGIAVDRLRRGEVTLEDLATTSAVAPPRPPRTTPNDPSAPAANRVPGTCSRTSGR
ncbi:hypothetical protein Ade02nite_32240 [Paractinoplanes deccanensis]|uniref:Uncharacterized protein n=1 Tax=Paractinoplanes deccanensis TaxID=113561 RepID=A0ABQ3Y3P1_9ACTN|nr:hypothetical protein Ade02nite_32240 [Actinoplanes deccanensis]